MNGAMVAIGLGAIAAVAVALSMKKESKPAGRYNAPRFDPNQFSARSPGQPTQFYAPWLAPNAGSQPRRGE